MCSVFALPSLYHVKYEELKSVRMKYTIIYKEERHVKFETVRHFKKEISLLNSIGDFNSLEIYPLQLFQHTKNLLNLERGHVKMLRWYENGDII